MRHPDDLRSYQARIALATNGTRLSAAQLAILLKEASDLRALLKPRLRRVGWAILARFATRFLITAVAFAGAFRVIRGILLSTPLGINGLTSMLLLASAGLIGYTANLGSAELLRRAHLFAAVISHQLDPGILASLIHLKR